MTTHYPSFATGPSLIKTPLETPFETHRNPSFVTVVAILAVHIPIELLHMIETLKIVFRLLLNQPRTLLILVHRPIPVKVREERCAEEEEEEGLFKFESVRGGLGR